MDKLDDTTYLNMRRFHERNIAGEQKKRIMMGRVSPPFKKAKGPIVYYVPEGREFSEKCGVSKLPPPPKIITLNIVPPLGNIWQLKKKPSRLQPRLEQVSSSILGH